MLTTGKVTAFDLMHSGRMAKYGNYPWVTRRDVLIDCQPPPIAPRSLTPEEFAEIWQAAVRETFNV